MEKRFCFRRPRSNTKCDADKSGDSVGGVERKGLNYMMLLACLSFLFGRRAMVVLDGGEWEGMGGWWRCDGLENE